MTLLHAPLLLSTMSGLADELLADLEELSDAGEDDYPEVQNEPSASADGAKSKRKAAADVDMSEEEEGEGEGEDQAQVGSLVLEGGVNPAEELDAEDVQQMELGTVEDVINVAKLHGSKRMADILKVSFHVLFSVPYALNTM